MKRALRGAAAFLILGAAAPDARAAVGVAEILKTARHAPLFQAAEKNAARVIDSGGNTPLIDNVQFQASLQEKPNPEQKYSVRLSPRGPGETAAQNRLIESLENRERTEIRLALLEELRLRYDSVAQLKVLADRKSALRELVKVHRAMAGWARKLVQGNPAQMKSLLDAETRVDDTELKLASVESEIAAIELRVAGFFGGSSDAAPVRGATDLAFTNFPQPSDLQAIGASAAAGDTEANVHLAYAKQRSVEAQADYETERAKGHRYFKFVDVGMENKKKEQSVFVELGFTLPFVRSDRVSTTQKLSKALAEENQVERGRRDLQERIGAMKSKLAQTARSFTAMTGSEAARKLEKYAAIYGQMRGGAPVELLVREKMLERSLTLADVQSEALFAYLELLSATGALASSPLRNYFSKNLEPL